MRAFTRELDWVATERERMIRDVLDWAAISSESHDLDGLAAMGDALLTSFRELGAEVGLVELPAVVEIGPAGEPVERPSARALRAVSRPDAPRRLFFGCHMDTVHPRDQSPPLEWTSPKRMRGPGVADAKGGIAVMRTAIEALERSPVATAVGWEAIVNPDEELSSPGAAELLAAAAARADAGLVFEPSLPDGALVGARKGSGYFTAVVRGRAAHVGRDLAAGRNAVIAAAALAREIDALSGSAPGVIANVGRLRGGGALNVVPDLALVGFNLRCDTAGEQASLESALARIVEAVGSRDGIHVELHGEFRAPPKPLDPPTTGLLGAVAACGRELGLELEWRPTGGVSDGNRLAAAGLPNVDTLGPVGGGIHTPDEYLDVDSLVERARLAALVAMRLAAGDVPWPGRIAREEKAG